LSLSQTICKQTRKRGISFASRLAREHQNKSSVENLHATGQVNDHYRALSLLLVPARMSEKGFAHIISNSHIMIARLQSSFQLMLIGQLLRQNLLHHLLDEVRPRPIPPNAQAAYYLPRKRRVERHRRYLDACSRFVMCLHIGPVESFHRAALTCTNCCWVHSVNMDSGHAYITNRARRSLNG
jgi:hypothetical protein